MDFQLSEEHVLIQNMVREFTEQHIASMAGAIDEEHRFPDESVAPMAEMGLFGFTIPEEFGGTGGDYLSYALATEEMSKVSVAHAMIMGSQCSLVAPILIRHAAPGLAERIVPTMVSGEALGCFCLTEPGAGCDASAQQTTAVRKGDAYVLNGSKIFITNAPQSEIFVVFAMTDRSKGVKGISAFLVERSKVEGLRVGPPERKMGINGSDTCEVFFKDVEIPAGNLLGKEGQGFAIAMETLDGGRVGVSAIAVGLAESALACAVDYIKERVQFGRPIAANQGIQWRVAEMATELEAARMLMYRAAVAHDAQGRYTRESSMAKLFCTETAMRVTTRAVQLMGGMGYTKSYPVERFMREAKVTEIYEGTNEIQRIVIAKDILG